MALWDYPLNDPRNPVLCQEEVYLRYPRAEDYDAWADLRGKSQSHLQPFEPRWLEQELTRPVFRKKLRLYAHDIRAGTARPYFIFRTRDDALVGGCTLSNIRYRAAMTATLGYWVGAEHTRCGYAFAAVCAVVTHAFELLGLTRVEAACLVHNQPSANLLTKAGFRQEGLARQYLQIDGKRQDHLLFALLPGDFEAALQTLAKVPQEHF
ncbi:GNAT family N-acetyltransferase [Parvularcula sp. IMCC14364]|uniref:GNAT family N-acetyltransferase n=1 Tax=Parvularcula sp. IMCC14364 TaxID=3067902 RepID=UPI002741ADE7|nr:GNAT family protein [Parvularcula sp. IMCC14364]